MENQQHIPDQPLGLYCEENTNKKYIFVNKLQIFVYKLQIFVYKLQIFVYKLQIFVYKLHICLQIANLEFRPEIRMMRI